MKQPIPSARIMRSSAPSASARRRSTALAGARHLAHRSPVQGQPAALLAQGEVHAGHHPQLPGPGVQAGEERLAGTGHAGGVVHHPAVHLLGLERSRHRLGGTLQAQLVPGAAGLGLEQGGALHGHGRQVGHHLDAAQVVRAERRGGVERGEQDHAERAPDGRAHAPGDHRCGPEGAPDLGGALLAERVHQVGQKVRSGLPGLHARQEQGASAAQRGLHEAGPAVVERRAWPWAGAPRPARGWRTTRRPATCGPDPRPRSRTRRRPPAGARGCPRPGARTRARSSRWALGAVRKWEGCWRTRVRAFVPSPRLDSL